MRRLTCSRALKYCIVNLECSRRDKSNCNRENRSAKLSLRYDTREASIANRKRRVGLTRNTPPPRVLPQQRIRRRITKQHQIPLTHLPHLPLRIQQNLHINANIQECIVRDPRGDRSEMSGLFCRSACADDDCEWDGRGEDRY